MRRRSEPYGVDAPLTVAWTGADAAVATIDVALNVSPVAILCEGVPFDAGAVTIAPGLLAHLPGATVGHLAIARLARARSNPPGTSVGLDLFVGHIASTNTTTP